MPLYRDVDVDVLGDGGRTFREYGETRNQRRRMISCFIQSETNERFRICIKPEEELLRRDQQQGEYEEGGVDEFGRDNTKRVKPWHLLATVKLDGRSEIERREFVLLDENDIYFPEGSHFIISGAVIHDEDGVWKKHEWMFKDVGIDVTLSNLQLGSSDESALPPQPEEDFGNAFGAMSATKSRETEERSKPGQIEVRLDRVTMGKTVWERRSVRDTDEALTELQGAEIGDLGHTIERTEGREIGAHSRVTYFDHMDAADEPYAIFRFNYCDEKKLRKLGFLPPLPPPLTITNKRAEALKLAAAVQKKKPRGGPNAYKFRNLDAANVDDGAEADDEKSESGREEGQEDDETGPSKDLPLGDLGEKLGELGMDRTRKYEGKAEEDGEKKVRTE